MTFLRYAAVASALLFSSGVLFSTQSWAAQCVNVTLRDENGLSRKTEAPVIGIIVPGVGPIVNQTIPPLTSVEPGLPAECPADLVATVQGIFNESCLSETARKNTAEANGQAIEVINQRCQSLYGVLNAKK